MARLKEKDQTYFTTVRGLCRTCRRSAPARVFFRGGQVWQESLCPDAAGEPALIAADQEWYLKKILQPLPDRSPLPGSHPPREGCPMDCGPCAWHASPCQLPVVSVTNVCNLECPICFTYNRRDRPYHLPVEQMRRRVDDLIRSSGPLDLINVTGGEPTLHPEILEILECCRRPEIGRVTMNSNGLLLAEDPLLCRRLAELGVHVVLSLNTFDPEASRRLHGRDLTAVKQRAVENLTRAGVRMTLLCVLVRAVNEEAPGRLLDLMRRNDLILSLTIQTMTYTGQGGGSFPDRRQIPVDEAAGLLCRETGGELAVSDFLPRPQAHPLCYAVTYLLRTDQGFLPLTRLAETARIQELLADSYLIRLHQGREFLENLVNELYARDDLRGLAAVRELVQRLYPPGKTWSAFERQRLAESAVRTIYIHAHMDEDTFDCSRAMLCPDLVAEEPGRLIPACTYNLIYRRKDERFFAEP